mgnify:CR=1 FL=1|jgi:hypothetical protein
MAVEPINGSNVNTNDYLQKNSQRSKNEQTINKTPIEPNENNIANINPVTGSEKPESQNFVPNKSNANANKDSLNISKQAKNAYNNQTLLNEQLDNNSTKTNDKLNSSKNPQTSYTDMEDKMYKK